MLPSIYTTHDTIRPADGTAFGSFEGGAVVRMVMVPTGARCAMDEAGMQVCTVGGDALPEKEADRRDPALSMAGDPNVPWPRWLTLSWRGTRPEIEPCRTAGYIRSS